MALGSSSASKVGPSNTEASGEKEANAANVKVCPIGFMKSLKILAAGDYMMLSEKVPTQGMQSKVCDNYVNVGVVAALLLSMVSISSDGIGDKLEESMGVPTKSSEYVLACLNTLSFLFFFLSVLVSLVFYIIAAECSHDEVVHWVEHMGTNLNSHFKLFFLGLVTFLMSQIWILLSLVPPTIWIPMLCACLAIYFVAVYAQSHAVRCLYNAKDSVANKGHKAPDLES